MQLFVKIILLRAGTSEPVGQPRIVVCPADVEPDTILSFLTQQLGEVIDTLWTSTERHQRIAAGWLFPGPEAAEPQEAVELACVPLIETADGLRPMFEVQADERVEFGQAFAGQGLDYRVVQQPQRAYQPAVERVSDDGEQGGRTDLDEVMTEVANETGATLTVHPRPSPAARPVVLQEERDDRGTRFEVAALGEDGSLTVTGRDEGPGVSQFFGSSITCYEWVYVVAPDRVPALAGILSGHDGDDILVLLADYYHSGRGQISDLMRHPDVTARFGNWHS